MVFELTKFLTASAVTVSGWVYHMAKAVPPAATTSKITASRIRMIFFLLLGFFVCDAKELSAGGVAGVDSAVVTGLDSL